MPFAYATVKDTKAGMILIEINQGAYCPSCPNSASCSDRQGDNTIWLENSINAVPGDMVECEFKGITPVSPSIIFFLLPAALLIIGTASGYSFGDFIGMDRELSSALFGSIFFIMSLLLIRILFQLAPSARGEIRPNSLILKLKKRNC
jgi:positive regulator of sigma E activity